MIATTLEASERDGDYLTTLTRRGGAGGGREGIPVGLAATLMHTRTTRGPDGGEERGGVEGHRSQAAAQNHTLTATVTRGGGEGGGRGAGEGEGEGQQTSMISTMRIGVILRVIQTRTTLARTRGATVTAREHIDADCAPAPVPRSSPTWPGLCRVEEGIRDVKRFGSRRSRTRSRSS